MSKESFRDLGVLIVLGIVCAILLVAEYFVLIKPTALRTVPLGPVGVATPTPTVEEILVGIYFDDHFPTLEYTLVIKKINGVYYKTEIFSDGSEETTKLNVDYVNGEERLIEEGDGSGNYMVIENNRDIAFYNPDGLLYRLHPK